ncbi:hypothetical protein GCM10010324_35550 [Streptomyces hiroshimensis]|uniref:Deoxyribonuclease NucA/NucB domain-containing protein n=1 Tax=Streptomyces hiroshimensis TaxID=66424 RepID=A0ABQ2YMP0_9ACTN|nr:hypothetical protein GCM10010324_35550 [Streptomyces hiroshimensis]
MRAATAVGAAALMLPLAASIPASADQAPAEDTGRTIVSDTPELQRVPDSRRADTGTGEAAAAAVLDCPVGYYDFNRTQSCAHYDTSITFLLNGRPNGTAKVRVKATAELEPRNRYKWKQKVAVKLTNPTIPEAAAVSMTVGLRCNGCTSTPGGTKILFPGVTWTFDMEAGSPGRDKVIESVYPEATITAPRHDRGTMRLGPTFKPRCDSTARVTDARTGGCVYPQYTPSWKLDVTDNDVAAVAWHVDWAQRNLKGHWGKKGAGNPLHRTMDQAIQRENRREACVRGVPRPPNSGGQSCDEYPMAQTLEGASRNKDYSCQFLNARQNSKEGSLRKSYLNGQRVLENDAFWVDVVKPHGAVRPATVAEPSLMGPVGCGQDPNP